MFLPFGNNSRSSTTAEPFLLLPSDDVKEVDVFQPSQHAVMAVDTLPVNYQRISDTAPC
jgi:hypothetical protein